MFRPALGLIGLLIVLLQPYSSRAQQAEAPIYKDGDWWRVRVDVIRPPGVSVAGQQVGRFPEYILQFESGGLKVIGVQGNEFTETNSPSAIALVLGRTGWRGDLLRFPMRIGLSWTDRFQFQPRGLQMRWQEGRYQVEAWEKIKTPKGEFDAFKVVMTTSGAKGPKPMAPGAIRTHTYYYTPEIKAIASFHEEGTEASVTSMLVDYNLAQ
jgi:hypothetical protein